MAKIEKLGSLYFDGHPQEVGAAYNGEQLSFGDTVPGQEISWVRLQSGLLVADRCVCNFISWKQLDKNGFVFGVPIAIDGKTYLCRCLCIGANEDDPNEWDTALDEAGEDNDIWHWDNAFFWGQEISEYGASYRVVRGWDSARYWYYHSATDRNVYIGFRPALEYLGSEPCSPDTLVNKAIKAYFPSGVTIEGLLVDFSDYDIMLRPSPQLSADFSWAMKDGCSVVINRGNIVWLKEA